MSFTVIPLSTVALCWKNSIHGVTVAPMSDSTISTMFLFSAGTGCQVAKEFATTLQCGCVISATGMKIRLNAAAASVNRSHVQYRWLRSAEYSTSSASRMAAQAGTPKNPSPALTAMNSVISVRKFPIPRSVIENQPQNGPNRSKISSACPRCVAAPSRTVISCTTSAMAKVSTTNGRKNPSPYVAPVAA